MILFVKLFFWINFLIERSKYNPEKYNNWISDMVKRKISPVTEFVIGESVFLYKFAYANVFSIVMLPGIRLYPSSL